MVLGLQLVEESYSLQGQVHCRSLQNEVGWLTEVYVVLLQP